jgi:phosphatidate cytidylyltransferase
MQNVKGAMAIIRMKQINNLNHIYIRAISAGAILFILCTLLYMGENFFKAFLIFLTGYMIYEVVRIRKHKPYFYINFIKTIFIIYILLSMGLFLSLYDEYDYKYVLFIAAIVSLNDTGAFFIGSLFKGPKLLPIISPHKTWSGLVGGVFFGMIGGMIILKSANMTFYFFGPQLLFLCLTSHAGDLLQSFFKRQVHVKDMGHIIPGHGGICDRLDSALLVNYAMYWLLR